MEAQRNQMQELHHQIREVQRRQIQGRRHRQIREVQHHQIREVQRRQIQEVQHRQIQVEQQKLRNQERAQNNGNEDIGNDVLFVMDIVLFCVCFVVFLYYTKSLIWDKLILKETIYKS